MKKLTLIFSLLSLIFMPLLHAAPDPIPDPAPIPRISVFSTSTDWESVTDLRYSVYDAEIIPDAKLIGSIGLEMYYLDGFPCYGQSDRTSIWLGQNKKTRGAITAVCLFAPKTVYFAWRNAARDALQDKTTGILECPNQSKNSIKIDLSKCVTGPEWKEYK